MDPGVVNFDVPQQVVASLKLGDEVRVSQDSIAGVVPRAESRDQLRVDEATRTCRSRPCFRNPRAALRPGMFVEVEARLGTSAPVVALPATAVSYAPYGNSVYVVRISRGGKDGKSYRGVEQRFVKLGRRRGDQVRRVSGLHAGEEVVTLSSAQERGLRSHQQQDPRLEQLDAEAEDS